MPKKASTPVSVVAENSKADVQAHLSFRALDDGDLRDRLIAALELSASQLRAMTETVATLDPCADNVGFE